MTVTFIIANVVFSVAAMAFIGYWFGSDDE